MNRWSFVSPLVFAMALGWCDHGFRPGGKKGRPGKRQVQVRRTSAAAKGFKLKKKGNVLKVKISKAQLAVIDDAQVIQKRKKCLYFMAPVGASGADTGGSAAFADEAAADLEGSLE